MYEELKTYQDIDIKFNRISKPLFNSIDLPLSGLYNDINATENQNYPLKNKFNNFNINTNLGVENLFQIKSNFDKLLTEETLEAVIILTNISNKDIVIKDLEISLIFDKNKKIKKNSQKMKLPDKDNTLYLSSNKSYSIKIRNIFKEEGKYSFEIKFNAKSAFYDQQYYLMKQKSKIKESNRYKIIDNHVEYLIDKKFSFNVNAPFDVKTKFIINQTKEEYFIEVKIKNKSKYYLTLPDLIIKPKNKNNIFLKPILNLNEIQENSNVNNKIKNTKIFSLKPEEELTIFFINNNKEIFLLEEYFILYIKWLNIFDFFPKNFSYEFKNNLNIFNSYFVFQIISRPTGNIILNDNFNIIFQFITKLPKKKFFLKIFCDTINDDEINIEIKEYKIELNEKYPKINVNILCKSDKLGKVKFPEIKLILYELNEENNTENEIEKYSYKNLICFNCIENVQLI